MGGREEVMNKSRGDLPIRSFHGTGTGFLFGALRKVYSVEWYGWFY